ncbi:MAG TPA: hypothetical protein VMD75_10060 [Candidatus Binataceae bacterium]|nr:hypothetical protein [Candidatus Binataceae bacterium]
MNHRRYLHLALPGALAALVAGCAVQGTPFERASAPPQHAIIYVYRPYSYAGSLLRPPVTCGDDTARIGPGGYHAFIVPVGKVICDVPGEAGDQVELQAEPSVYYIREEIGWGVLSGHPHLNPIDTDQAQTEIQHCCVLEPDINNTAAAQ